MVVVGDCELESIAGRSVGQVSGRPMGAGPGGRTPAINRLQGTGTVGRSKGVPHAAPFAVSRSPGPTRREKKPNTHMWQLGATLRRRRHSIFPSPLLHYREICRLPWLCSGQRNRCRFSVLGLQVNRDHTSRPDRPMDLQQHRAARNEAREAKV